MKKAFEGERTPVEPNYLYTVKELIPVTGMSENRIRELIKIAFKGNRKIRGDYRIVGADIIKLFSIGDN